MFTTRLVAFTLTAALGAAAIGFQPAARAEQAAAQAPVPASLPHNATYDNGTPVITQTCDGSTVQ